MLKGMLLYLIRIYQSYLSPFLLPSCRFYPTCSQYAYISIQRFGLGRGVLYSMGRILRCHPLSQGGYDPPPDEEKHGEETLSGHLSFNSHPHSL